ncbi:MAG: PhnD/SsuA/transferrin family substrate-binding protein [Rhodoferax sp.]|nr:PhnD/SsuA/transferrin family substrate-binding protein [Rhodoferax sp.]
MTIVGLFCRGRTVLRLLLLACLALPLLPAWANLHLLPIRIGIPHKTLALDYFLIDEFRVYLESRLSHPVEAVVHGRFNNTTAEMVRAKLEFAWVTDYPDSQFMDHVQLLAVPMYNGQPSAKSYTIVSALNVHTTSLGQLRGSVFAFADRQANGSYLDVRYHLLTAGENPDRFFKRMFFTRSHKDVIKAVALGLAHAGAVDSVIWDRMVTDQPDLTKRARVIAQSPVYGAPAFIANRNADPVDVQKVQHLLLSMDQDPVGKELLKRMRVDAFVVGDERIYQRQLQMRRALGEE